LQPVFSYLGLKAGDLPVAEQAAREVLALPMFPELTEAEIRAWSRALQTFTADASPPIRRGRTRRGRRKPGFMQRLQAYLRFLGVPRLVAD
jgi:hypothetical protein